MYINQLSSTYQYLRNPLCPLQWDCNKSGNSLRCRLCLVVAWHKAHRDRMPSPRECMVDIVDPGIPKGV